MSKVLFLPGASGSASFWKPIADRAGVEGVFFAWPGLGPVGIQREFMTAAARQIIAEKLSSVLSARMAMRLNSFSLQK